MNKKEYIKPSVEVVALQQQFQILAGSKDIEGMEKKFIEEEEVDISF